MNYDDKLKVIEDILRSGEKSPADYTVGFEAEHFIVDKDTIESLGYFDPKGVRESLTDIENMGYEATYDGEYIQGLTTEVASISIEPGAQFEVALNSHKSMEGLVENYQQTMGKLVPLFEEKNQLLVQTGYQPKTKIADIKFNPKKRYKYMSEYFLKHGGSSPFNMMKGSGSLQVAIDYTDEADFSKKYFVANAISTFLYTTFDNTYIFEGEPYPLRNLRQSIWETCDKERSGMYPFSFDKDLGYKKYAERILNTDSIFINKNGKDIYTGTKKFVDIFDEDSSKEMVLHALSIVFPDVRAKYYIEVRMPDNVPYPYNFAAVALIKNIFYDTALLDWLYEELGDMSYEAAENLKSRATKTGLLTSYEDKKIYEWMLEIISKIKEDRDYIEPIKNLLENQMTPRDVYETLYKEDPVMAAYEFSVNKYIKDLHGEN